VRVALAGTGTRNDAGEEESLVHLAQGDGSSGRPIDILEEDSLGGHTFERHVNKPDEYLTARILRNRVNIPWIGGGGEKRAGSFTSLEAANKLVNATIADPINQQKIKGICCTRILAPVERSVLPKGYYVESAFPSNSD